MIDLNANDPAGRAGSFNKTGATDVLKSTAHYNPTVDITQQHSKAERLRIALWYAWRMPELHRHEVIQEGVTDPIIADVFTAVLSGDVARLESEPGGLYLDLAAAYEPPPALIAMLKKKQASLPADFFAKVAAQPPVMVMPEIDPGEGEWPGRPSHTCDNGNYTGTAIIIRGNEFAACRSVTPAWRDNEEKEQPGCRACQHERAKRAARQILIEKWRHGRLWYKMLESDADYRKFAGRARYHRQRSAAEATAAAVADSLAVGMSPDDAAAVGQAAGKAAAAAVAYAAFPMSDDRVWVIHTLEREGRTELESNSRADVLRLVAPIVNDTPEDKRIATSDGWGGNWQGVRGDGRIKAKIKAGEKVEPALRMWTKAGHHDIAAIMGEAQKKADNYTFKISARESFHRLAAAGVTVYLQKNNELSLDEFLQRHDVDVLLEAGGRLTLIPEGESEKLTHKGEGKTRKIHIPYASVLPENSGVKTTAFGGGSALCE